MRIVWVTDGSDDGTNERLQTRWAGKATVHFQPLRQGKTAAMTRGMTLVDTPLVVFTDANTMVNREAIREIVLAFRNPKVGCVAGEKRIAVQAKDGAAAGGEGIYWKYESTLRRLMHGCIRRWELRESCLPCGGNCLRQWSRTRCLMISSFHCVSR